MYVSASEIESTLQKAMIGLGLGVGCGVEAGRSALSMLQHDVDPAPIFAAAFDNVSLGQSSAYDNARARGGVFAPTQPETQLSAIIVASAICDALAAGTDQLLAESVDVPVIVLMSLLARGLDVELEGLGTKKVRVSSTAGQLRYENGGIEDFQNPSNLKLTFIADFEPSLALPPISAFDVDGEAWSVLLGYVARCLVVGSEQSRLTEAGAGLVDKD